MSIVRFEFRIVIKSDEASGLYPTNNPDVNSDAWGMLETYQAEGENGKEQLTYLLLTNFRLIDYTLNQIDGTFSILATPGHVISPEELCIELYKINNSDTTIRLSDHRGVLAPVLKDVFVLNEQKVDLTKIPCK